MYSKRKLIKCAGCGRELMLGEAYPHSGCRASPKPKLKDYRTMCLGCWMSHRLAGCLVPRTVIGKWEKK